MKPIEILVLLIASIAFYLSYKIYKEKKQAADAPSGPSKIDQMMATKSTVVIVDPVTLEEYIISQEGDNALDSGPGTFRMRNNIELVISTIENQTGKLFAEYQLKTYDPNGNLVGVTKISNPLHKELQKGTSAVKTAEFFDGSDLYSCAPGAILHGPDYYKTTGGDVLFGMFCKEG